ncbi:uncharacterized protein Z519_00266 [Cladophialophora bantiana CBS 173.52]|uniref:SLC26A/SulP transporter domain-containing protein n=1 Tax=Cladophialophora bantiana (strain ATCC 10958 / CBS 173.52 / CDC B-1940 / NIH 8579) TaxID=1442370 RepID=A0A0D2I5T0_CLAB1|nr:uncharacterized protein Z519_00266 [Cladophialophora bantiana CBS 173.52]KIW98605.1 hypothetical protein Z519_00266 [Cladophialophora bantiana CBS 173.52]
MDAPRARTEKDGLLLDQDQCRQYGHHSTGKAYQTRTASPYTSSNDEGKTEADCKRRGRSWHGRLIRSLLPGLSWISKYRLEDLSGDLMGATTVAAVYAPLSVSFALVGHAHPTSGMVSFIVCALIYALLGHCRQMIIGPEAPGSFLVRITVALVNKGTSKTDADPVHDSQLVGAVTATAGTILLVTGLTRLASGFTIALGIGVVVEQEILALGLKALVQQVDDAPSSRTGSSIAGKFIFILENLGNLHVLSALLSISSFTLVMAARSVKTSLKTRYPMIVPFPDRLFIVILAVS